MHQQVVEAKENNSNHFTKFEIKKMDHAYSPTVPPSEQQILTHLWKQLQTN
jgi:hypothetical protein